MQFKLKFFKPLIILLLITSNVTSQKKGVSSVEVKKTTEIVNPTVQALTYMLPKTTILVEIESEKIVKKTGPYYRYSQRYLNLSDVITEDSEEWIIKNIKIKTKGTPNEDLRYSILSSGLTSAFNVNLTHKGILKGINLDSENTKHHLCKKQPDSKVINLEDVNFDNIPLHEDLLFKTSTAAMAQEAANMIYKIRNNRIDLLSGDLENLPPDGEAYKSVLKEINKMESDFVSLFAGKTITSTQKQIFEITPDPLSSYNNHVICRFSSQKGVVNPMDITGTPIYFNLEALDFKKIENKQIETPKDEISNGLFYCIPASAKITILDKNKEVNSSMVDLAQYGQVVSMQADILKQDNVTIRFCPTTGALISIGK